MGFLNCLHWNIITNIYQDAHTSKSDISYSVSIFLIHTYTFPKHIVIAIEVRKL